MGGEDFEAAMVDEAERSQVEADRLAAARGEAEEAVERLAGEGVDFAAEDESLAFAEEVERERLGIEVGAGMNRHQIARTRAGLSKRVVRGFALGIPLGRARAT